MCLEVKAGRRRGRGGDPQLRVQDTGVIGTAVALGADGETAAC
jgi:hypothetical protein